MISHPIFTCLEQWVWHLLLALAQSQKMIAIDGDGSVLTNFGTLPTIANNVADNFILFIIDNGSYGSTGDQPTYAGKKLLSQE
jgi:sulfopyruvate decarboxylase subunit beta